jgi:RNA polymerase primary sigma factor
MDQVMELARALPAGAIDPVRWTELRANAREAHAIRSRFVASNIGLVGMFSRKFAWTHLDNDDLMQEGTIGLMHAIGRFDPSMGLRFSTYATNWIKHHMRRAYENSAEVRIPVHIHTSKSKVFNTARRLRKELGREPTEVELARGAGMTLNEVSRIAGPGYWITGAPMSLDTPSPLGHGTLGDAIADPDEESALATLINAESIQALTAALDRMTGTDADVLRRRFGFGRDNAQTLIEIGQDYGRSRERIRQIETRAIKRLRRLLGEEGLEDLPAAVAEARHAAGDLADGDETAERDAAGGGPEASTEGAACGGAAVDHDVIPRRAAV